MFVKLRVFEMLRNVLEIRELFFSCFKAFQKKVAFKNTGKYQALLLIKKTFSTNHRVKLRTRQQ